jgi:hypothetical protein
MYLIILTLHSLFRWVVLLALLTSLFRAYRGWLGGRTFTAFDNSIRHNSATVAHLQLVLGYTLYLISPFIASFHFSDAEHDPGTLFFGVQHVALMTLAIAVLTIGSALAKRRATDREKFRTMAVWFTLALLLILVAIPWPFSPLAQRPLIRL